MRRGLWALAALALALTACAAPAEKQAASEEPAAAEQTAPEAPMGQDRAIAAYGEIVTSFTDGAYPAEFGDAYLEDNYLWVCLTDDSEQMRETYRALTDDPEILRFRKVDYGYNDLRALQDAIVGTPGIDFASVGVDVMENRVDVGIPDLDREQETLELIREHLPPELAERFPEELPVQISQEDFATLA